MVVNLLHSKSTDLKVNHITFTEISTLVFDQILGTIT